MKDNRFCASTFAAQISHETYNGVHTVDELSLLQIYLPDAGEHINDQNIIRWKGL